MPSIKLALQGVSRSLRRCAAARLNEMGARFQGITKLDTPAQATRTAQANPEAWSFCHPGEGCGPRLRLGLLAHSLPPLFAPADVTPSRCRAPVTGPPEPGPSRPGGSTRHPAPGRQQQAASFWLGPRAAATSRSGWRAGTSLSWMGLLQAAKLSRAVLARLCPAQVFSGQARQHPFGGACHEASVGLSLTLPAQTRPDRPIGWQSKMKARSLRSGL